MAKKIKWFFLLSILAVLITSCQPAESVSPVEPALSVNVPVLNIIRNISTIGDDLALAFEKNECLKCHASQEQLIETADPVEPTAESESKGVG